MINHILNKSLNISSEEKFIIYILFKDKNTIKNKINFKKINYRLVVEVASSHLVLPALYFNLKKKKIINEIPNKLKIYLKKIFNINKERNKILIKEIKEISKILNDNDIEHIFLKGASHIISDLYDDIGERMIGDIDILTKKNESINAYKIFKTKGYKISNKNDFFYKENKHLSELSSKNKVFSIEFHKRLLDNKNIYDLEPSKLIKTKLIIQKIPIVNFQNQFLHNIYNYQINDNGNLKSSYSYRSFYDTYLSHKKKNIDFDNIEIDNYLNNYLMIARELKVPIYKNINFKENRLNLIRFKYKKSNKTFYKIDNFITKSYKKIIWLPKQIRQLLINGKYRKYVINKITG